MAAERSRCVSHCGGGGGPYTGSPQSVCRQVKEQERSPPQVTAAHSKRRTWSFKERVRMNAMLVLLVTGNLQLSKFLSSLPPNAGPTTASFKFLSIRAVICFCIAQTVKHGGHWPLYQGQVSSKGQSLFAAPYDLPFPHAPRNKRPFGDRPTMKG